MYHVFGKQATYYTVSSSAPITVHLVQNSFNIKEIEIDTAYLASKYFIHNLEKARLNKMLIAESMNRFSYLLNEEFIDISTTHKYFLLFS